MMNVQNLAQSLASISHAILSTLIIASQSELWWETVGNPIPKIDTSAF